MRAITYRGLNDARQHEPAARDIGVQKAPPAGPETVDGATEIMAAGFAPIETLTGAFWVVNQWPEQHRRSVPETRPEWIDGQSDGRLWFVRSPWDGLSASQVLSVIWAHLPREDESQWPEIAGDILTWTQTRALEAFRALPRE